jgi:hypothetical protein
MHKNTPFVVEASDAGLIFSGRVVTREEVGPDVSSLRYEVVPTAIWKCPAAERFVFYSVQTSCKVDLALHQEHLFMLQKQPKLRVDSLVVHRCRDYYSPLNQAPELGLVKALFVPSLRASLGSEGPRLNASEAEYFAGILPGVDFRFDNQLMGFFADRHQLTKQEYFNRYLTERMLQQLVVFSPAERAASGGYAAMLVSWPNTSAAGAVSGRFYRRLYRTGSAVSPTMRRRLLRRLHKNQLA